MASRDALRSPRPAGTGGSVSPVFSCYGEGITEALEKAQDVHLAACEAGAPDPEALAERLVTGALESGWGCSATALISTSESLL